MIPSLYVSSLYASILAVWICWLILSVVKARQKYKVEYGDGDVEPLKIARSAHSNATETIPVALILLFSLEYNGGNFWVVHVLGMALVVGRILHGKGMLSKNFNARVKGMIITLVTIVILAVSNLAILAYKVLVAT